MTTDQTFVDQSTIITATWLNGVNRLVNDIQSSAQPGLGDALFAVKRTDLPNSVATTGHFINQAGFIFVGPYYGLVTGTGQTQAQRILNATAIANAQADAKAVYAHVWLPVGAIEVEGNLTAVNGVNVYGMGGTVGEEVGNVFRGTTIFPYNATIALDMLGTSANVSTRIQCRWQDMNFNGTNAGNTCKGMRWGWNMRSLPLLRNVGFIKFAGNGQDLAGDNWDVSFENCRWDTCGYVVAGASAIQMPASVTSFNRITYFGCTIEASGEASSNAGGMWCAATGATLNLIGCEIEGNIGTQQLLIQNMYGFSIIGCHSESTWAGGTHFGYTFGQSTGIVQGGHVTAAGAGSLFGIRATDSATVTVSAVDFNGWVTAPMTATVGGIIHTSGPTYFQAMAITVDATSQATGYLAPRVSVHKNGTNQTGIVTATPTKVTFSSELFDTLNSYTGSTFTPQAVGVYSIDAQVGWTAAADGDELELQIWLNGANHKSIFQTASGTGANTVGGSVKVKVTTLGNTIELYAKQSSGSNKDISGAATKTWFMATYLGPG